MGPLPFSSPADTPEKKKERGPSLGGVGGGAGGQERRRAFFVEPAGAAAGVTAQIQNTLPVCPYFSWQLPPYL